MRSFKQYITEAKLPKLKKGDTILTGKWKNSPAIVKGFGKDKNNQPTIKTNKGVFNLYKFRIKKLMESVLKTLNNSRIKRYKNNVGKDIGGQIYVHKNYAQEVIPNDILKHGLKHVPKDFKYNSIMWDKNRNIIRFDSVKNFDSEREPVVGDYIAVLPDGSTKQGKSPYIWHHKWLWVKDDYTGFNVPESIAWSKEWLSKLNEPASGKLEKWNEQLRQVGLK